MNLTERFTVWYRNTFQDAELCSCCGGKLKSEGYYLLYCEECNIYYDCPEGNRGHDGKNNE